MAKRRHTTHYTLPSPLSSLASIWQWFCALFSLILLYVSCLLWQLIVRVQECALCATQDICMYIVYMPDCFPSVLAVAWVMRLLPCQDFCPTLSHVFHRRIIAPCSLFAGDLHMLISHGSFCLTNVASVYAGILTLHAKGVACGRSTVVCRAYLSLA